MTEDEVVDIAKHLASTKGWPWIDPVQVNRKRRLFGKRFWTVLTNCDGIGSNVYIEVDESSRAVVKSVFRKR